MTTKQIDYCIELAHTLNFSRAAENMFVSQPTLTYQIKLLEEEVGFTIFERSGKGAALTPAGAQFASFLAGMREDLKRAIEQGQNFSATYRDSISISLMVRQAVFFLPEAIRLFEGTNSDVQIAPVFQYENGVDSFLRNETDILFALKEQTKQIPGITVHELFESRVYLIADRADPLAGKNIIHEEDLYGRTLMVGGGSPPALKAVQNRLINSGKIRYFNSPDHDTTLTNVAAG
ncbi:MAG: LysR family transcriptional regulator, partial [Eubacteriales bacterium]